MEQRIIRNILSMGLLALVAAGCSKEQDLEPVSSATGSRSLVVETSASVDVTKVSMEKDGSIYKMNWDAAGEEASLIVRRYDNWQAKAYNSNSASLSGGKISFSFGPLDFGEGTVAFDILYPLSSVEGTNVRDVYVDLPSSQTPEASYADPAASLLVGRATGPEDYGAYSTPPASLSLSFTHVSAYVKMNLKGIPAEETITSISVTAEDCNIAGGLTYKAHMGTLDYARTSESTITLDGANLTANPSGFDVWFACKPFTLPAGKKFTVTTVTNVTTHTAVLTAAADVTFAKGKVTGLPAFGNTYTVTFDSQGGSAVEPVHVIPGGKLVAPSEPSKAQSLSQGLYLGDIDDPESGALFAGWYTDAGCTSAYNFSDPVTASFTLYAKWETRDQVVDLGTNDTPYHTAVNTINGLALADETVYTLVIDRDVDFTTNAPSLNSANAVLKIVGKGSERTLHAAGVTSNVLSVKNGKLVLGNNLRIYATDLGNYVLVSLDAETAKVQMEDGCRLSGSTGCTADAIIVKINSTYSEFIMNGGEISNNSGSGNATRQATILNLYGIFTMNGGVISGNSVETNLNTTHVCGGVMFNGWTYAGHQFTKTGGEIKDNTATRVTGATGEETGLRGQQVLIYGGAKKKIDTNVGTAQNLDASSCYSSPWTGAAL